MILKKKAVKREETNFAGGSEVTPIVDRLYSSLYQFAVGLTKSESDAADLVQQTFSNSKPTLGSNPRLLKDQELVVYDTTPEFLARGSAPREVASGVSARYS